MCDFCEGVLGDCVREECIDVAMVTIANAQQEWQLQEKARILEEVRRVVAMEIEIEVVNEQASQVGTQVMRYCAISFRLCTHLTITSPHLPSESYRDFISMVTCICDEVTCEVVRGESQEIGEEVIVEAENKRQEKLEKLEKQFLMKRRLKYWKRLGKIYFSGNHSFLCCSVPDGVVGLGHVDMRVSVWKRSRPYPRCSPFRHSCRPSSHGGRRRRDHLVTKRLKSYWKRSIAN